MRLQNILRDPSAPEVERLGDALDLLSIADKLASVRLTSVVGLDRQTYSLERR